MITHEADRGNNRVDDTTKFDSARFSSNPPTQNRTPEDLQADQVPVDLIDEASMESFPCSDPPGYTRCHA